MTPHGLQDRPPCSAPHHHLPTHTTKSDSGDRPPLPVCTGQDAPALTVRRPRQPPSVIPGSTSCFSVTLGLEVRLSADFLETTELEFFIKCVPSYLTRAFIPKARDVWRESRWVPEESSRLESTLAHPSLRFLKMSIPELLTEHKVPRCSF